MTNSIAEEIFGKLKELDQRVKKLEKAEEERKPKPIGFGSHGIKGKFKSKRNADIPPAIPGPPEIKPKVEQMFDVT